MKEEGKQARRGLPKRYYALAFFVLVGAALLYLRNCRPPGVSARADDISSICPPRTGKPLIVTDTVNRKIGKSGSLRHYSYLNIIDPNTGKRRTRLYMGKGIAKCFGYEGEVIWIAGPQLHARDTATGKVVVSYKQIEDAIPVSIHRASYDESARYAYVTTSDGRKYYLSARDGLQVSESATQEDAGFLGTTAAAEGRSLSTGMSEGIRRTVTLDGQPLGQHDFLRPELITIPGHTTSYWPELNSAMVTEETELESGVFKILRLGIDGSVHWEYTPARLPFQESQPWVAWPGGKVLLYFTSNAVVIGLAPDTGRELYRLRL